MLTGRRSSYEQIDPTNCKIVNLTDSKQIDPIDATGRLSGRVLSCQLALEVDPVRLIMSHYDCIIYNISLMCVVRVVNNCIDKTRLTSESTAYSFYT